ncbi:MAG: DUF4384 domain-containing protein [Desulfovibrio sp.]|jgi:hypothetical protein|nr:DUF4384 domain-containing protein [Desulfovibrio sp.]
MKKLFVISLLFILCAAPGFIQAAQRTTRDLVFEDDETAATKTDAGQAAKTADQGGVGGATQTIAVKTTMLLTRDGQTSTVLPNHEFKSGDRVKLVYTPSIDGFVYWMTKGTSGEYKMIFPSEKTGMDNKVERNKEYTIPTKGAFKFDDKTGKEELLCVLSPSALPDLDSAVAAVAKSPAAKEECKEENASAKRTTRDLVFDDDEAKSKDCVKKEGNKRTTRDLVFDDDDAGDVNTQKQTGPKGEPLVAHYVLEHK